MADFNIDNLNIQIAANATKASNALDKLTAKVDKLTKSMERLAPVATMVNKSLKNISKTTKGINAKPLGTLSSNINNLTKQSTKLNRFSTTLNKLAASTKKVQAAQKVSSGSGTSRGSNMLGLFGAAGKIGLIIYGLRRVGQGLAYTIEQANRLTESTNLFTVAMGDSVNEAQRFVDTFATKTGLNPVEIMEGTALFYQISTSMGLAADNAQVLSENFTKLAFDLSSLFNISTEDAFTKLKAGLVGETEPLRRLGIVITENNLAETARRLGITKSIRTMTEMEKMQLRYITALEQTKNAQGDFARTIETPANMLRVLSGSFQKLTTAIGQLFIPALQRSLPYIIAFVDVLTMAISRLATFLGYEAPEFDGITSGLENIEDQADATGKAIRGVLAPFDELNVINSKTSGSSGGLAGSDGLLDLDLTGYDNLVDTIDPKWIKIVEKMTTSFNKFKKSLEPLEEPLNNLKTALEPFTNLIGDGLKWFHDNALVPFGEWIADTAYPKAIEHIADTLNMWAAALNLLGFALDIKNVDNLGQLIDNFGTLLKRSVTLENQLTMLRMVGDYFSGGFITKLINAFSDIKTFVVPNAINAMGNVAKRTVNVIIEATELLLNRLIDSVNRYVNQLNNLYGVIGLDVIPNISNVDFGQFELGPTGDIQGPRLSGGFAPATFDTSTPKSTGSASSAISDSGAAFRDYIESQSTGGGQTQDVVLNIDGKEMGKATLTNIKAIDRQNGKQGKPGYATQ